MLSQEERYRVLCVIRQCCKFAFLPARVELTSWELIIERDGLKIWKHHTWFFLAVLHGLYKLSSLAEAWFPTNQTPLHEKIIQDVVALAGSVYLCWYCALFVKNGDVLGAYAKMTLTGNIGDGLSMDHPKTSSWIRRMKRWTLQDFFAVSLPYSVVLCSTLFFITLICNPSMKLLLYAGLPSQLQSWIVFCVLFLEEIRFILVIMSIGLIAWILQIIAIDLVSSRLRLVMDSLQRNVGPRHQQQEYKSLRHIQLYVGIFNEVNSFVIWSWKELSMSASIASGYAAIAFFRQYPGFGIWYYLILLNSTFLYIAMYGRAFEIPASFETITKTAVLGGRYLNSPESKIFKRQMRSVPCMGIKVGEFHTIERESTLIFVDFVLNNIVGMLVANNGSPG